MRLCIVTLIIFIIIFNINAQYLLVNNSGELMVINYNTKEETIYYDTYVFREQIKLADIYGYNLVGYNWKSDSLIVFLEQSGLITKQLYSCVFFNNLPSRNVNFITSNLKSMYRHTSQDLKTIYSYDNIKIINTNGLNIKCYKDSIFLWEKNYMFRTFGIGCTTVGYQLPIISEDKQNVLFQLNKPGKLMSSPNSSIIEINIKSGYETQIATNAWDSSYSSDNKYILFYKGISNGYSCIYDKIQKKVYNHFNWEKAFWLYK